MFRRSQCPRGLRCRSAAASLLGLRVRIPPRAWISVSYECCVRCQVKVSVSGWSCVHGLIMRSDESCRVWCVWVWLWSLDNEAVLAYYGLSGKGEEKVTMFLRVHLSMCNWKYCSWKGYEGNRIRWRALGYLTEDRVKPRALVNAVMKLTVTTEQMLASEEEFCAVGLDTVCS